MIFPLRRSTWRCATVTDHHGSKVCTASTTEQAQQIVAILNAAAEIIDTLNLDRDNSDGFIVGGDHMLALHDAVKGAL